MNTSIHQNVAHSKHCKPVPLFVAGREKPVAFFSPRQKLLYKTIDGRKHFVRVPPGLAFDDGILQQAGNLGAVDIAVTDGATGDAYRCALETFLSHCEVVDRGYGRQLVLRLAWWSRNGQPSEMERIRSTQEAKAAAAEVQQLGLFG